MSAPFDKENSFALLIGVGKRDTPNDSAHMAMSASDAQTMGEALSAFSILPKDNITTITNNEATCDGVKNTLRDFGDKTAVNAADLVIVYFSGHGCVFNNSFYLICNDTREEQFPASGLPGADFVELLTSIRCDKMLVLLDCCHSGELPQAPIPFDEATLINQKNRVIITSSSADQESYLSQPVSVFTYAVIEGFGGKLLTSTADKAVTVFDLAMDVRERVATLVDDVLKRKNPQQPQLKLLQDGQTTNFTLARYPKGVVKDIKTFKADFAGLKTADGKGFLNLDIKSEPDTGYRTQFNTFITQHNMYQNYGDGNIAVTTVFGTQVINHNFTAKDVSELMREQSAQYREAFLAVIEKLNKNDEIAEIKKQLALLTEELQSVKGRQRKPTPIPGISNSVYENQYWQSARRSENKITLQFHLSEFASISFQSTNLPNDFADDLVELHKGIKPDKNYIDALCQITIDSGHNLLKSTGIFYTKSVVVEPMSQVIGQYLFRLLFGYGNFQQILRWVYRQRKELEIILQFDNPPDTKKDEPAQISRKLASLPWELMYCPEAAGDEIDEVEDNNGFFVSKVATVYRQYEQPAQVLNEAKGEVEVMVGILSRDAENLDDIYDALSDVAERIGVVNPAVKFSFLNTIANNRVQHLAKSKLSELYQSSSEKEESQPVIKVLHLICDVSVTQVAEDRSEKVMFFQQAELKTQPVLFKEVLQELFLLLQDNSIRFIVLQAWKDEDRLVYSGFEEIARKILLKFKRTVLTMPYAMNHIITDNGKAAFFQILYSGIAHAAPLTHIVQKLRTVLVQTYAYGFPILYLNGDRQLKPSKEVTISPTRDANPLRSSDPSESTAGRQRRAQEGGDTFNPGTSPTINT